MNLTAVRVAVATLVFTVVGMVAAAWFDLAAQLTTGGEPASTVGIEVIWAGSAVSAPWLPVVGLLLGAFLATRDGRARATGLVLLLLMGLLMTVGWAGEYLSGIPFTGIALGVFVAFSVVGFLLTFALIGTSVRELVAHRRSRLVAAAA